MPRRQRRKRKPAPEPPHCVADQTTANDGHTKKYQRGCFLGKGGFASVYILKSHDTGNVYAGKCVWKQHIHNRNHARKLIHEIQIHGSLSHPNIVKMERHFEDKKFVYILLELCDNGSMMELLKKRVRLIEEEARYYLKQIIEAIAHLHKNNIIHRDLKLGNLLLDKNLRIKLADFGLAAQVKEGGKRTTICGTPNYIAPEILNGRNRGGSGHSYEVDIWSLGVISYTLICGRPPFETNSLEKTYSKIRKQDYEWPDHVVLTHSAKTFVSKLLVKNAASRPNIEEVGRDTYFNLFTPKTLPNNSLYEIPIFPLTTTMASLKGLKKKFDLSSNIQNQNNNKQQFKKPLPRKKSIATRKRPLVEDQGKSRKRSSTSMDKHLQEIQREMVNSFSKDNKENSDNEMHKPTAGGNEQQKIRRFGENINTNREKVAGSPDKMGKLPAQNRPKQKPVWVLCWLVCKRYGLGYVLSNGCYGVYFNDMSKILLQPDHKNFFYIQSCHKSGKENISEGNTDAPPESLRKKVLLLVRIHKHITTQRNLKFDAGGRIATKDIIYVKTWESDVKATLFRLSNKLVQVNYHDDDSELLLDPRYRTATYTDKQKNRICVPLDDITKRKKYPKIREKLIYARGLI